MISLLRNLLITLFLVISVPGLLHAQRTLGIQWDHIPEREEAAIEQLQKFHSLGISLVEVSQPLAEPVWNTIDSLGIEVYGDLGIRFPTATTFENPDSALVRQIRERSATYFTQPSVTAIGLFAYGAESDAAFREALQPIVAQFRENTDLDLYYKTSIPIPSESPLTDFTLQHIHVTSPNTDSLAISNAANIGSYLFSTSEKLEPYVTPFKQFLDQTSDFSNKPIFLNQQWLQQFLAQNPDFDATLRNLTTSSESIIPLPEESLPSSSNTAIPIILLLAVWGSVAFHYHSSPVYRKALFRYFTAHKFFVEDIFQRQIRSPRPGIVITLQNAILVSACVFATFSTLLSSLGQQAFFYHFKVFTYLGTSPLSMLLWTMGTLILLGLISIMWLHLTQQRTKSLIQTLTIYSWPLHLNLIFGTATITMFSAGASGILITIFTTLTLLTSILAFVISSFDLSRLASSTLAQQAKTNIPYLAILIAGLVLIFNSDQIMQALRLALNL